MIYYLLLPLCIVHWSTVKFSMMEHHIRIYSNIGTCQSFSRRSSQAMQVLSQLNWIWKFVPWSVLDAGGGGPSHSPPATNTSSDNTSGGQSSSRPPTASGSGRRERILVHMNLVYLSCTTVIWIILVVDFVMCTLWSCISTTIIRRVMDHILCNRVYCNVLSNG